MGDFVDSTESSEREMSILFPKFDFKAWYQNEEFHFRSGNVYLDRENFEHRINSKVE